MLNGFKCTKINIKYPAFTSAFEAKNGSNALASLPFKGI